jgi:glutathione S-transferase
MEGISILNYLTKMYDKDHKFSFTDPFEVTDAEQWMAWQHGGLGTVFHSFPVYIVESRKIDIRASKRANR